MAKKNKKSLVSSASPSSDETASPAPAGRPSKKRTPAAKSSTRTTASKGKTAAGSPRKAAAKQISKPRKTAEPSDADIQLRAYFIAERRVQLALQGDPANDWLEAKKELLREARQL